MARLGSARPGMARQARLGAAWPGTARQGAARQGTAGAARHGLQAWFMKLRVFQWRNVMSTTLAIPADQKTSYEWKYGSKQSGNAQMIGERLESIRKCQRGFLSAGVIIEYASKNRYSELGKRFEWDDTIAARKHREDQARAIIRFLVVKISEPEYNESIRLYVRVFVGAQSKYTSMHYALSDADMRAQVVETAMKEAREWRHRYRNIAELARIFEAIDGL